MSIFRTIRKMAMAVVAGAAMAASAAYEIVPSLDTELNDFDPTVALGRYAQKIASNTVEEVVVLSNGVLTVGDVSINVAEPTHTVITTNNMFIPPKVETNVYNAVYEDGLANTLKDYATIQKIVSIVTNGQEIVTNWTTVAYMNDIPADSKKADKVIRVWDYQLDGYDGVLLTRSLDKDAPFSSWEFLGDTNGIQSAKLFYTNGIWNASVNGGAYGTVAGAEDAATITFADPNYTFTMANDNRYAFVVYTDFLEQKLGSYMAKTNLYGIAEEITDQRLTTMGGIQEILRGIRSEINNIAGGVGIHLSFRNVRNSTLHLASAIMQSPGDTVEINWGDGQTSVTNLPASHQYGDDVDDVEVTISGFIREISGTTTRSENGIFPFASFADNGNDRLVSFRSDSLVGLSSFGFATFYGCTGLSDRLTLIPESVTNLGEKCFAGSGITSLAGMPSSIHTISVDCFAQCNGLRNLAGLSPGITRIESGGFRDCINLESLEGLTQGLVALGSYSFCGCSNLVSIAQLGATSIQEIPESCFEGCISLSRSDGIPSFVATVGARAFAGSYLESCVFPAALDYMGSDALLGVGSSTAAVVEFLEKSMGEIQSLPQSSSESASAFPWGVGSQGSFKGIDGTLVYNPDTGMWETNSISSMFTLSNMGGGNYTVYVGATPLNDDSTARSRKRAAASTRQIDWGDGTIDSSSAHDYTNATDITISILGDIRAIESISDNAPFIAVNGKATNEYLTAVSIGNAISLKSFGASAFKNCPNLDFDNITGIRRTVSSIGDGCFAGCGNGSIDFLRNSSVSEIPAKCFAGSGISDISDMPASVTAIGAESFRGCSNLISPNALPPSLCSIGAYAFAECGGLDSRMVERLSATEVDTIPNGCFSACTNFTHLTNGLDKIKKIGDMAFSQCRNVSAISIGSITNIGSRAFEQVGQSVTNNYVTEDGIAYKVEVDITGQNVKAASDILGLEGEGGSTTGLPQAETIVNCADNATLVWHPIAANGRWEVIVDALEIALAGVPSNTEFQVKSNGAMPIDPANVSLIWNWGDGTTSGWVSGTPSNHKYTREGRNDYLIKVKGLLGSLGSARGVGAVITPVNSFENPYLVGFRIPDGSTLRSAGDYAFSKCPNLRTVDSIEEARSTPSEALKKKTVSRAVGSNRIGDLYAQMTNNVGAVEFGEGCFEETGLVDLETFPKDSTRLATNLFNRCTNLVSISGLGNGIVDIGADCFRYDSALSGLDGFPASLTYISDGCFAECSTLSSLAGLAGSGVASIGDQAFYNCKSLESLEGLPASLRLVGADAFANTGIRSLDGLPAGVLSLGQYAFSFCTNLVDIPRLPTALDGIEEGLFYRCSSATNFARLPDEVGKIGRLGFGVCNNLVSGELNGSISNIDDFAIMYVGQNVDPTIDMAGISASTRIVATNYTCDAMIAMLSASSNSNPFVEFECSDGYVTCMEDEWVALFKTIEFRLKGVGRDRTYYLGSLGVPSGSRIKVSWGDGQVSEYAPNVSHKYADYGDYKVTLTGFVTNMSCTSTAYPILYSRTGSNPNLVDVKIGRATLLNTLGDYCFAGCTALTNLTGMTDTLLMQFGKECFRGCTALNTLRGIPEGLVEMGDGCFRGCSGLTSIEGIPDTFTKFPSNCFAECTSLASVSNIPSAVESLGYGCFSGCTSLKNLNGLPSDSTYEIGDRLFAGCTGLRSLQGLGTNITDLSIGMFRGCTGLSGLDGLHPLIDVIPDECFEGCTGIVSLAAMPSAVYRIGDRAFMGCSGLTSLAGISPSLLYAGDSAFAKCSLSSLDGLPSGMAGFGGYCFATNLPLSRIQDFAAITNEIDISRGCFSGCPNIGTVAGVALLPPRVRLVGESAFKGCSLKNLTEIPANCAYIEDAAFDSTSITNLVMYTNNLQKVSATAFAHETNTTQYTMLNFPVTRTIRFPQLPVDLIFEQQVFPFGASDTTAFIGSDGFIVKMNGIWVAVRKTASATFTLNAANLSVTMEGLVPEDDSGVIVDWGDGQYTIWPAAASSVNKKYAAAGEHTLSIYRGFSAFGIGSTRGRFIYLTPGANPSGSSINVTSVTLEEPSGCQEIGMKFCYGARGVVSAPRIPSSVTNIGEYALGATSISSLTNLPSSVTVIGREAFGNCTSMKVARVELPFLESIPDNLFKGNVQLESVGIDCPRAKSVGASAFEGCSALPTLDLSKTAATNVGDRAFADCTHLSQVVLPKEVESIGVGAFSNIGKKCQTNIVVIGIHTYSNQCTVIVNNTVQNFLGFPDIATLLGNTPIFTRFQCYDGSVVNYRHNWIAEYSPNRFTLASESGDVVIPLLRTDGEATINWGDGTSTVFTNSISNVTRASHGVNVIVEGYIREIAGSATSPFLNANLREVRIGQAGTNSNGFVIGDHAFAGCTLLDTIENITAPYVSVGKQAFKGCSGLGYAELTDKCATIGEEAFDGCSALSNVVVRSKSISQIKANAFANCPLLSKVTFLATSIPASGTANALKTANAVYFFADSITNNTTARNYFSGCTPHIGSKFCTFDADVVYDEGTTSWVVKSRAITITLNPAESNKRTIWVVVPEMKYAEYPDFKISWGDGTVETFNDRILASTLDPTTRKHQYAGNGTYQVKVIGWMRKIHGLPTTMTGGGYRYYSYSPFVYGTSKSITNLTSIVIGDGVGLEEIGEGCFAWLRGLRNVTISPTVQTLGNSSFLMTGVQSLGFLPRGITTLPDYCFSGCRDLRNIGDMPNVTSIGKYCFGLEPDTYVTMDTNHLANISMPSSVRSLGEGCFRCSKIDSLTLYGISSGLASMGKRCFEESTITQINHLPAGIVEIPENCFHNTQLNSMAMPSTVSNIAHALTLSPFYGSSLEGISPNLTSLKEHGQQGHHDELPAIGECPNLLNIDHLPNGIGYIPNWAFSKMPVKTVIIPRTVSMLGYESFQDNTTVVMPHYTDNQVYQTVEAGGQIWLGDSGYPYPWNLFSFHPTPVSSSYTLPLTHTKITKRLFVNGAAFKYSPTSYGPQQPHVEMVKYKPYIKAKLDNIPSGTTVKIGYFSLEAADTPFIIDWGDGTWQAYVGEPSDELIKTYGSNGNYTIAITTVATEIGPDRQTGAPFIAVSNTTGNSYLTEFRFSDSVGIGTILANTFANCPNLKLISCDSTVQPVNTLDANGVQQGHGPCEVAMLKNSRYTTAQMKKLANFPWGYTGSADNVRGVDSSPTDSGTDGDFVRYKLENVPAGTTIGVFPYEPKSNGKLTIYWGDGSKEDYYYSQRTSVRTHTYAATGKYSISIIGETSGTGLRAKNGKPCIYVSNLDGNPYLTSVTFGNSLAIKNIGAKAFKCCSSLAGINLEVLSKLMTIDSEAFMGTAIIDFNVPYPSEASSSNKQKIGSKAFFTNRQCAKRINFYAPIGYINVASDAFGEVHGFGVSVLKVGFNATLNNIMRSSTYPFVKGMDPLSTGLYGLTGEGVQTDIVYQGSDGQLSPSLVRTHTVGSGYHWEWVWPRAQ